MGIPRDGGDTQTVLNVLHSQVMGDIKTAQSHLVKLSQHIIFKFMLELI